MFEGLQVTEIGQLTPQVFNSYRKVNAGSGSSGSQEGIVRWEVEVASPTGSATLTFWGWSKDGNCRVAVEGTLDGDARRP